MERPSIEEQQEYYDSRWRNQEYINRFALMRAIAILEAIEAVEVNRPKILDLGCGTGWLTGILNEVGPATGIELSEKAIQAAKRKYPSVEFIAGDIFSLRIPGMFDIVVSQEVLEHVENQEGYIEICYKCLKDGGYLILTTPNALNLKHWTKKGQENWNLQPIENWLGPWQLKTLLKPQFDVLKMKTIIPEYGEKGVFRVLSSVKINKLLAMLRLKSMKDRIALHLGLGLHIVVLARKI